MASGRWEMTQEKMGEFRERFGEFAEGVKEFFGGIDYEVHGWKFSVEKDGEGYVVDVALKTLFKPKK